MDDRIHDPDTARRFARTIVSDLAAYHQEEVEQGIARDDLFLALGRFIDEGRHHFESRVDPDLLSLGHYEQALVDFLLKPFGHVESRIW